MVGVDLEELMLYVVVEKKSAHCYDIIDSYEQLVLAAGRVEDLEDKHPGGLFLIMEFRPTKESCKYA